MARKENKAKRPLKTQPNLKVKLNDEQVNLEDIVKEYDVSFVEGIWGSGKTLAAVATAIIQFRKRHFNEIILTRPYLKDGLGALPGGVDEKLALDMQPILDNINRLQDLQTTEKMFETGELKIQYNGKVKGNTFSEAICVCDEAQDLTKDEFIEMLTRLGKESKIIFTVSKEQIHKKIGNNSCYHMIKKLKDSGIVGWLELKSNHRNPIISEITDYLGITKPNEKNESVQVSDNEGAVR